MSRHTARARSGSDRTSLYDEITTKIITELEAVNSLAIRTP
jgi:antirestriction protein ArdC